MSELFGKTTDALGSAINFRLLRQNVTTANIANAETPGYKAKKVDFEEALARAVNLDGTNAMSAEHEDHFATGLGGVGRSRADVYDNPEGPTKMDGNTVDLENEMATLAENSILYKAAIRLINKKLATMRYAVSEGSR